MFGKGYKIDLGGGGVSLGAGVGVGDVVGLRFQKLTLLPVCLSLPCRSRCELLAVPDALLPAMMVMVSNPLNCNKLFP